MTSREDRGVDDAMLTLRQAANRTGLSATTLRRYIKSSRLRARLVPGRYGPEYVVSEDDLATAGLHRAERPPVEEQRRSRELAPARDVAPLAISSGEVVPAMIYRELLMKHEQLLVQFGMLKVTGRQIFESRQQFENRAADAQGSARDLERLRQKHAREIGELKTSLRKAELEIAARADEIREYERTIRQLEIRLRNADTARTIEADFARVLPPRAEPVAPPARISEDGYTVVDH
ncbi:MAG: hypothetical protein OEQ13_02180 [Acidobacteriota bacterium]|nr:hypothetical protein [Acidobacteriota bacterium]